MAKFESLEALESLESLGKRITLQFGVEDDGRRMTWGASQCAISVAGGWMYSLRTRSSPDVIIETTNAPPRRNPMSKFRRLFPLRDG